MKRHCLIFLLSLAFFPAMAAASKTIRENSSADFSQGEFDGTLNHDERIYCGNRWDALNGNTGALTNCRAAYNGSLILFGGRSSTSAMVLHNTTYSFNPVSGSWDAISVSTAPSERMGFGMAGGGNNTIALFGGYNGSGIFDDTWLFSGGDWSLVECSTHPSARMGTAMARLSADKIILFGGKNGPANYSDTWIFDTAASSWTLMALPLSPGARANHAMAHCGEGKVMLYGGEGGSYLDDCWIYDSASSAWTEIDVSASNPGKRSGLAMTYDNGIERVWLFGGETEFLGEYSYNKALWMFNPASESWTQISVLNSDGEKPDGRKHHIFRHSPGYGNILFGGGTADTTFTEKHIFSDLKKYVMFSSGTYTTKIYDTGVSEKPVEYKSFWRYFSGTGDIKYQLATSTGAGLLIYTGPAGAESYYTNSPQDLDLEASRDGDRYFSVKIFLSCLPENVPDFYISELNLKYNHLPEEPVLYGKITQNGDSVFQSADLRAWFYWFNAGDPDDDSHSYEHLISTAADFSVYVSSSGIAEQGENYSYYHPAGFYTEGKYYWKMRAADDYGSSGFSEAWCFYVDTTAPSAVTDLTAEKILDSPGSVRLSWTCTGDNGLTGDIEEGQTRIQWKKHDPLTVWGAQGYTEKIISTSVGAGRCVSTVIDGLENGTSYYFVVALKDEVINPGKNLAAMSNNALGWTDSAPGILSVDSPAQYDIISGTALISFSPLDIDRPDDETAVCVYLSTDSMASWHTLATDLSDGTTFFFFNTLDFQNSGFCNIRLTITDGSGLSGEKISEVFLIQNPNYPPFAEFTSPAPESGVAGSEVWAYWQIEDGNPTDTHLSSLEISGDSLNWSSIAEDISGTSASFNSKLLKDGTYYLKVTVEDSQIPAASAEAVLRIFIANGNTPPGAFNLVSPANGIILNSEYVSFAWDESSDTDGDAVTYTLIYSTHPDFSYCESIETPFTSHSSSVANRNDYYWKVRAADFREMETESSETFLFSVYRGSMTAVGTFPENGSYGVGMTSVTLYFNNPVDPLSVSDISVKEAGSEVAVSYDIKGPRDNVLVLKGNFAYPEKIRVSVAGVKDNDGNNACGETDFLFKNFMPAASYSVTAFSGDNISVTVSSASFAEPCFVEITKDYSAGAPARSVMEMTRSAKFVNDYGWLVEMTGVNGSAITPGEALIFNAGYANSMSRISANNVFAVKYISGQWQKASPAPADGAISFPIMSEGPYALAALKGTLSAPALINKPNPLRSTTEIWADNPAGTPVIVEVFALTGEKVYGKTYPFPAAGFVSWDGKDNSGFKLPDGMYELSVTASGKTMKKLLGIVR
ncbi:MAG: kelch repeat-containing protein [Elusimicrobiota bacterium]|nr:kelch repeat-containing protein [Elusimicrobiota bacterium]